MMRWIVLVVLLVGLSAAGTVAVQLWHSGDSDQPEVPHIPVALARGPRPRAVLDGNPVYEFGTLPQRTTGKHTWTVHNTGEADLELTMLSSTCSCTLAKFKNGSKAIVPPGKSDTIDLEFETRENNGEYLKGAEIGTNDPALESFSLRVKGMVYPAVITYPPEAVVNFGQITNESDDNLARIAVYSLDRPETKVVKITSANPNITGEVLELTPEELKTLPNQGQNVKRAMKVNLKVKAGMPLGLFREEAVIVTDHPKQPEVRVSLNGRMNGPIKAMPSNVMMHDVYTKAGAAGEIRVLVANRRPTKFKVVKKPEALDVEIVPSDADKQPGNYRLIVKVPPATSPQRFEGEIVLETDHPKAAEVIIPVSVWVLNAR
jgi:hypothetical protein